MKQDNAANRCNSDKVAFWFQRCSPGDLEFLGCHDISDLVIPQGELELLAEGERKRAMNDASDLRIG